MIHLNLSLPGYRLSFYLTEEFPVNCVQKGPFLHNHSNFEIRYDAKDCGSLAEARDTVGTFTLIPPHKEHLSLFPSDSAQVYVTALYFSIQSEPGRKKDSSNISDLLLSMQEPFSISDTFGGNRLLLLAAGQQSPFAEEICCANLLLLLCTICAQMSSQMAKDIPATFQEDRLTPFIEQFIIENYPDPDCSFRALAQKLFISERQLYRIMQNCYHLTFRQFLTRTRMEMAKTLLFSTNLSQSDVAEQIGYRSGTAFAAAYRTYYKASPAKRKGNPPERPHSVRSDG